jgi:hypothetical protein
MRERQPEGEEAEEMGEVTKFARDEREKAKYRASLRSASRR